MDPKEICWLYLGIGKLQLSKFNETRSIEWKINLSIWAAISSLIFSARYVNRPHQWLLFVVVVIAVFVLSIMHYSFLNRIQLSEEQDWAGYLFCRKKIEALLDGSKEKERTLDDAIETVKKSRDKLWVRLPSTITFLLLAILAIQIMPRFLFKHYFCFCCC